MKIRVDNLHEFTEKAVQWATGFDVFCLLDSCSYTDQYSKFDLMLAAGVKEELHAQTGSAFSKLEAFRAENPGWITGFFSYDLKNETESLCSENIDELHFPDLYFFVPQYILIVHDDIVEIIAEDSQSILDAILSQKTETAETQAPIINLKPRFSKEEYINTVKQIKEHISRGDIYVTNFCQEFYAENAAIDPFRTFTALNRISPTPFTAFFKLRDKYILCASPERFLAKRGKKLISQPIKGTAKRYNDPVKDQLSVENLQSHTKEQQENVMIVDLVRNDLTRSAREGTVRTEELFGIYSFSQVHQMISTIVCELGDKITDVQAIKNAFPMGSMTGAPKVSAMKLMERYEQTKRGVYSGAIGYFSPDGGFDFNVVIRSLLYNETDQYLSFQVGSAITYHAEPEKEYEECLLKAQAILEALGLNRSFRQPSQ